MRILPLLFILTLIGTLSTQMWAQITPDMVVAKDGSGDFTTLQAAIDAVPSNQTDRRTIIYIKSGLYNTEKLIVPTEKINVTLIGESRDQTIISYHIYDCTNAATGNKCPAEDAVLWTGDNIRTSATLTIMGSGFRAENLTVQNTAGPVGQALALTIQADKTVFVNCDIKGYQDTIYLWTAGKRSYFENCLVVGRTDYIYGAGIAYFQACEIRSWGGGWITAPSTPQTQPYGFVFNECNVTYATGSPRAGDDGFKFRFGRPWHEYPKVSWLRCDITEMLNPEGWGDTWSMSYAATSTDLHLYEYKNTGLGADMSGRAAWAGLRAMTDEESLNYTVQKVLGGSDNWDPSAEAPLVTIYTWTGAGANAGWLTPENWNPNETPATGEVANASGNSSVVEANGGTFAADLNLKEDATLNVTAACAVSYLTCEDAIITAGSDVSLSGKIATKDSLTLNVTGNLTINATLAGVHKVIQNQTGKVILNANNSNFAGLFEVKQGTLEAAAASSLGKGNVTVFNGGKLTVGNENAFFPKSVLKVVTGATLNLNASVMLTEFFIDGVMQPIGTYNSTTNPFLITGTGAVVVGRPTVFTFIGGANGNWDVLTSYSPALMPIAGDTVMCAREIETTSTVFPANIILEANKGSIRPRGSHTSNGWLEMNAATKISYATSGAGFTLTFSEIRVKGNISIDMNTGNTSGAHVLTLPGTLSSSGAYTIKLTHPKSGMTTPLVVTCALGGNNANLSCDWDVTTASLSEATGCYICLKGNSANSLGTGKITVGKKNKVSFDHALAITEANEIVLLNNAKAILNASVTAKKITFGGIEYTSGSFSATSHPDYFEGTGSITISGPTQIDSKVATSPICLIDHDVHFPCMVKKMDVRGLNGLLIISNEINANHTNLNLPKGIYLIQADNLPVVKIVFTK